MDLQQQAKIVDEIRTKIKENVKNRVFVRVNLGRSRINENVGTVVAAHPSVFIVELEYRRGRKAKQSFQYADILTGVVEIYQNHEPMFGPFNIQPDAPLVAPSKTPQPKKRLRPEKPFEQRIRLNSDQVALLAEKLKAETEAQRREQRIKRSEDLVSSLSKRYDAKKKGDYSLIDTPEILAEEEEIKIGTHEDILLDIKIEDSQNS